MKSSRYLVLAGLFLALVGLVCAQTKSLSGVPGSLLYHLTSGSNGDVPEVIYTDPYLVSNPTDPLHAAFAQCPTTGWVRSTNVTSPGTEVTDPNGNIEVAAVSGTTGAAPPSWPAAGVIGTRTADGSAQWISAGRGVVSSAPCIVVVTPGTYPLPSPLLLGVGGPNSTETLSMYPGANIKITDSGGLGHAGIVIANKGAIKGSENSQNSGSIVGQPGARVDAIVESWCAYGKTMLGLDTDCPNMSVENVSLSTGQAQVSRAVLWAGGVEGQGFFSNLYISPTTEGSTGIRVDDITRQWNAILFSNVWIGASQHANNTGIGYDIECGANAIAGGSQSLQIIGGAVVDFGGPSSSSGKGPTYVKVGGDSAHHCINIVEIGTYFETTGDYTAADTGGTLMDLAYVSDFEGLGLGFNGGKSPLTAINITGIGMAHVTGNCKNCDATSTLIKNNTTGYSMPAFKGDFNYIYNARDSRVAPATADGRETLHLSGITIGKLPSVQPAPGAGACNFFAVPGTRAGSCKIQATCGTSTTPVTIADGVGVGC